MMNLSKNKIGFYIVIIFIFVFIPILFAMPHLLNYTASPEFCSLCHVMAPQYEDWFYSGSHKQIKCVDCHLPNDGFIRHYIWKSIDGFADTFYFFTGMISERIIASGHTKKTIKENCIRCHGDMVSDINTDAMNCWDCHRSLYHNIIK